MGFQTWPPEGGGGSAGWGDPVDTIAELPPSGNLEGAIRVVLDTYDQYLWNGSSWILYYQPLPDFPSQQLLYGDGSKVPAFSPDLIWDDIDKILRIGTSAPASNARIIMGGALGFSRIDGSNGGMSILSGPLQLQTNTSVQPISFWPGGVEALRLNGNALRAEFFVNVQHNLLPANRALSLNASKEVQASIATDTELDQLAGVISPIQTQLDGKLNLSGGTMTGPLNLNNAIPTGAFEAAPKAYVDSVSEGLDTKASVAAGTTGDITLSGLQTIDGVPLSNLDRVLVKDQSDATQNGLYVAGAGAWTRTLDFDTWAEVPGAFVFVQEGAINGGTGWVCIAATAGTIGSTPIPWTQFSGAGTYKADGNGLELIGTIFFLELDGGTLSKSASGLKVADASLTDTQIAPAAGIQLSKLEAQTFNRAIVSDGAGKMIASSTTATEIGHVGGVTSPIQTQLNSFFSANSLSVISSNATLLNRSINLIDTTVARTVTLPAPSSNGFLILKDKSGLADSNAITVARSSGGVKIEGVAADVVINTSWTSYVFVSDGTDWFII